MSTTLAALTNEIYQVKVGNTNYDIAAKYIHDGTNAYEWSDITNLVNTSFSLEVLTSLPTANASAYNTYSKKIVLIASGDGVDGSYDEYVILRTGTSTYTYAWELIGTTKVELQGLKTSSTTSTVDSVSNSGGGTATGTATISYEKANANTGNAGAATTANSSYATPNITATSTFTGTAATISATYTPAGSIGGSQTVAAHSHTVNVTNATFNLPTNAIKSVSLTTATTGGVSVVTTAPTQAAEAGGHTHSLNLTTDSSRTFVTTAAIKSAVLATTTAAVGTGVIQVVTGVNNAASAGAHTHSITPDTTSIYQISGVGSVPTRSSRTVGDGSLSGNTSPLTTPVVTDGVLSFPTSPITAGTTSIYEITGVGSVPTRASLTVVTGVSETGSAGAHTHSVGASATQKLTVTTEGASTISKAYVTGASATATSTAGAHTHSLSGAASSNIVASGTAANTSSITYVTGATLNTSGGVTISGSNFSFTGTQATLEADYTPAGSVSTSASQASHRHTYVALATHSHSIGTTSTSVTGTAAVAVASHTHTIVMKPHQHDTVE